MGRYIVLLLILCCVLIFAIGLISRKQSREFEESEQNILESMQENTEETDASAVISSVEDTVSIETAAVPETVPAADTEEGSPIYIRINHEKQADAGFSGGEVTWSISDENIADVDENGVVTGLQKGECTLYARCGEEQKSFTVTVRELTVDNGCTYVDGILVANKSYSLPEDYDPGLMPEAEEAFEKLTAAAGEAGLNIYEGSGYRTYSFQVECYNSILETYGKEYADSISARPGYSEHQTGYTIDCNTINDAFGDTEEGKWLAEHCAEYGFIIRYPEGKEDITGYAYESWHIRYVGVEAAKEMTEQGITLEEYLDIDSVYQD
jgi:preprotein translocase subunit YajC